MLPGVTYDVFIQAHPEFSQVNPTLVDALIAQATRRTDPSVFRATTDDYIGWLTGKLLFDRSPEGFNTRLEAGETSIYEMECNRLIEESGDGMASVAGGQPLLPGRFGCR